MSALEQTPPVTLHREINALGGATVGPFELGYNRATGDVLTILERRGFTEAADVSGQAEADELRRIAEQVGEAGDPFAAWEAIDAIIRERDEYLKALNAVVSCTSGNHAVHIAHAALATVQS